MILVAFKTIALSPISVQLPGISRVQRGLAILCAPTPGTSQQAFGFVVQTVHATMCIAITVRVACTLVQRPITVAAWLIPVIASLSRSSRVVQGSSRRF